MPRRTPGSPGRRLTKAEAVALLERYDHDPVGAIGAALRIVLERTDSTWPELLVAAPMTATRRAALLTGEQGALDDLARELNETRTLVPPTDW